MRSPSTFLAFMLAGALLVALPASATGLRVDYRITLAGLTLGQADLSGTFDDARYSLRMNARSTGLAGILSGSGRGSATATGALRDTRLSSGGFSATGRSSSSERTVQMGMAGDAVTAVAIEPPFEFLPDRVELTPSDKAGVIDPLSATLAVAPSRGRVEDRANCDRTLPVFDGTQRFDVQLSFAETRRVQKPGFAGNVLVCNARYVPVAGHRPARPSVQFMRDNREISVWLAPVEGTRVLVPIRISLATMMGTSVVEAERWTVTPDAVKGELRPTY